MAWTVQIEDENGKPNVPCSVVLEFGSLPTGSNYPICTLIEKAPYYDTILNPIQVEAFLVELNDAKAELAELRHLTEQALRPHTYVRFIGD